MAALDIAQIVWYISNIACEIYHKRRLVMKRRYGFLGFISLIGLLGLIEKNADFYPFLAFILFFQYLFVQPDEMFVENMRKAADRKSVV